MSYENGKESDGNGVGCFGGCNFTNDLDSDIRLIKNDLADLKAQFSDEFKRTIELATGHEQIPARFHFLTVGCLFALLLVMFLYFTHQEARFSAGRMDIKSKPLLSD